MQDGSGNPYPIAQHQSAGQRDIAHHAQNAINGSNSLPHLLPYSVHGYAALVPPPFDTNTNTYRDAQSPTDSPPAVEAGPSNVSLAVPPKGSSGGKTFQCTGFEGCAMSFSRNEHLARHVRKHTGEKPFACRCGKKFTRLDNLRQHASTIHADEPEANEELFTRLAANLPRSGRVTRRKPAQTKQATNPTNEAIVDATPDTSATTTASHQLIYSPSPYHQPETFLPPLASQRSQLFPDVVAHASTAMAVPQATSTSTRMIAQPLPSPSFRFPLAPNSQSAAGFQDDHQSSTPYNQRSHSTFPSFPQEVHTYAREQQLQNQYPLHPSHASDYGRDGSSFRVTQPSTFVPPRVEYPSSSHFAYAGGYTPVTTLSGGLAEPLSDSRAPATFSTKPILPSLSSLIAGAPAPYAVGLPDRRNEQSMKTNEPTYGDSDENAHQFRLNSTLLVAAEMAIHDTHQDQTTSYAQSLDSRSSSFSMSSANTSGRHTSATSPAMYSPCLPAP